MGKLVKERISEWHTERDDYDYRYHWGDNFPENDMNWWVEYRDKIVPPVSLGRKEISDDKTR